MALEDLTGTSKFLDDLVITNPVGASDGKDEGDDHIRGIKNTLKNSFPNIDGTVTGTPTNLNLLTSQEGGFLLKGSSNGAGTVDAITADFTPNITLTNHVTVLVRAQGVITSATPTFAPDELTAKTIVKGDDEALDTSDIPGAGFEMLLTYNSVLDKWVLLNPAPKSIVIRGTVMAMNAGPTITTATDSIIGWADYKHNTEGTAIFNTTVSTTRLFVPAGITKIELAFSIYFDANNTGYRKAWVLKNGSKVEPTQEASDGSPGSAVKSIMNSAGIILDVVAGDYFEIRVHQTSGGNLVCNSGTEGFFSMRLIE